MFGLFGALFGGGFLLNDLIKEKRADSRNRAMIERVRAAEEDRRRRLLNPTLEEDLKRAIADPRCSNEIYKETSDIISCMPEMSASNQFEEKLLIMMVNRGFWPIHVETTIDCYGFCSSTYIRRLAFFKWAADVLNRQGKNVAIFASGGVAECDFISNSWCKNRPECQQDGRNLQRQLEWQEKLTDIQLQKELSEYIKNDKNYDDVREEVRSVIQVLPELHPENCEYPCPISKSIDIPGIGANEREALFILMVNRGKMPLGGYCGVNGVAECVYHEAYNGPKNSGIPREGYLARWAEGEIRKKGLTCSLKNNVLPGVYRNWV